MPIASNFDEQLIRVANVLKELVTTEGRPLYSSEEVKRISFELVAKPLGASTPREARIAQHKMDVQILRHLAEVSQGAQSLITRIADELEKVQVE